jgi:hypothetical protein
MSVLLKPRLTDYYGVHKPQAELDFAIPLYDEDIPLYVDPFLLWKSPAQQDQSLHLAITGALDRLWWLSKKGKGDEAQSVLIEISECDEVGLGSSLNRKGKRISARLANEILANGNVTHLEELQLLLDGISKDRISDIACSLIKSFLVDFTIDQCETMGLPLRDVKIPALFDNREGKLVADYATKLPCHPENSQPIILVPKRWLRFTPWINFDDYFKNSCPQDDIAHEGEALDRVKVLNYNRENYGVVQAYLAEKERAAADCVNDPLFKQIPVITARNKLNLIQKLPTGLEGNAHQKYEDSIVQLLASMLYPYLDFAQDQSRTDNGVLIRDLIFYNHRSHEFLKEVFDDYDAKQLVFEIKNVQALEKEHVNQLNRYMAAELGRFGVLVTRNDPVRALRKNIIDLWSGQRRAIIVLTDADIAQMVELFDSKQRHPLDVLKKKYVEFRRECPA